MTVSIVLLATIFVLGVLMSAPRGFDHWIQDAVFHARNMERCLAQAADTAPSADTERDARRLAESATTAVNVLKGAASAARQRAA